MPVLKNARHEKFAQALAKGSTADDAYENAGFKPDRGHASRLAANGNVQARVGEIKSRAAEKAEWTAADRLVMLKVIAEKNIRADPRSTIAAIGEANKMQGSHAPAKLQHTGADGGPIKTENRTWREVLRQEGNE
jgi:phage terminase small subunit